MTPEQLYAEIDRVYRDVWSSVAHPLRLAEFGRRMYELGAGGAGDGWQRLGEAAPNAGFSILIEELDGMRYKARTTEENDESPYSTSTVIRKLDGSQVFWHDDLKWKYF